MVVKDWTVCHHDSRLWKTPGWYPVRFLRWAFRVCTHWNFQRMGPLGSRSNHSQVQWARIHKTTWLQVKHLFVPMGFVNLSASSCSKDPPRNWIESWFSLLKTTIGGGFNYVYFHPENWEIIPLQENIFSDMLNTTTNQTWHEPSKIMVWKMNRPDSTLGINWCRL